MSLILTPPPTVMVFFKEISLKNESTGFETAVQPILGAKAQTASASYFIIAKGEKIEK